MMGMGRGEFPPHDRGPPMDFYYNPYMDDGMGWGTMVAADLLSMVVLVGMRRFEFVSESESSDEYRSVPLIRPLRI